MGKSIDELKQQENMTQDTTQRKIEYTQLLEMYYNRKIKLVKFDEDSIQLEANVLEEKPYRVCWDRKKNEIQFGIKHGSSMKLVKCPEGAAFLTYAPLLAVLSKENEDFRALLKSFASSKNTNKLWHTNKDYLNIIDAIEENLYMYRHKFNGSYRCYVDGSYNKKFKNYSYGFVIVDKDDIVIYQEKGVGNNKDYVQYANTAGEAMAAKKAVDYAIKNNCRIDIHYDFVGIYDYTQIPENTSLPKDDFRVLYCNYMNKNKMYYTLSKVVSKCGNKFHNMAHNLADKAFFDVLPADNKQKKPVYTEMIAYVSGSHDDDSRLFSHCFIITDSKGKELYRESEVIDKDDCFKQRTIIGKLTAIMKAIEYVKKQGAMARIKTDFDLAIILSKPNSRHGRNKIECEYKSYMSKNKSHFTIERISKELPLNKEATSLSKIVLKKSYEATRRKAING